MLKIQPEISKAMKIILFLSHLPIEALQTFKNINDSTKQMLESVLISFRRKYVRQQSQATAKPKSDKLIFNYSTKSLPYFIEELNECAERAFGPLPQQMIDSLLYPKLPPHLKRPRKLAALKNGTYD